MQSRTLDPLRDTSAGVGWSGFTDGALLVSAALALTLATVLAAMIAHHPFSRRTGDRLAEVEAQKAYLLYSAIGAMTGLMVEKYGVVVGFVVFGIGGLMRFRTDLRSAPMTGRLIFVTLVGLACGLDLPHLAVFGAAFGWLLIAVLDASTTYRITVKGLAPGAVVAAARAYHELLAREGCRVLGERKHFTKEQLTLVFRAPRGMERERLAHVIEDEIPREVRGAVDWETA